MNKNQANPTVRGLSGTVVSVAMLKTISVEIKRTKTHPLYHKKFTVTKKIKAQVNENDYQVGDIVEIVPCRPLSRDKHFIVKRKIVEK